MSIPSLKPRSAGFTLIELLVVIAIIALLASLTIGAFSYATTAAGRNRTSASQAAIMAALERYNADFGEYPTPATPEATAIFNNKTYRAGGAEMLYQALSGDGTSAIQLATGGGNPSDGQVTDQEAVNIKMTDIPKDIWLRVNNSFYMVDGFRKPFQYTKGGQPDAINPTYDLWSLGQDEQNTQQISAAMKANPQINSKWIINW
jgi:prepilin-type N-terminal cleavage/methylation domain-containing protein